MKAGVDVGSSLVKVAWKEGDELIFRSTANLPLDLIVREMEKAAITQVYLAGIGYVKEVPSQLRGFELYARDGDPIQNEVELQADGTRQLISKQGLALDEFLLVSIGTGTSYTIVTPDTVNQFPIGNSISGGFIRGLAHAFDVKSYEQLVGLASHGTPLDIYVKDKLPETDGTPLGEFVVANFGHIKQRFGYIDVYATIMSTVGIATVRDVMLIGMIPGFEVPDDVVYIGSTLNNNTKLNETLEKYTALIGKTPHFLDNGQFALAVGAYNIQDSVKLEK